jgi:hypothetical protein
MQKAISIIKNKFHASIRDHPLFYWMLQRLVFQRPITFDKGLELGAGGEGGIFHKGINDRFTDDR